MLASIKSVLVFAMLAIVLGSSDKALGLEEGWQIFADHIHGFVIEYPKPLRLQPRTALPDGAEAQVVLGYLDQPFMAGEDEGRVSHLQTWISIILWRNPSHLTVGEWVRQQRFDPSVVIPKQNMMVSQRCAISIVRSNFVNPERSVFVMSGQTIYEIRYIDFASMPMFDQSTRARWAAVFDRIILSFQLIARDR